MRMLLAILICKILRFVGRLVGKGSSLPGAYALKVCPDVLSRAKLPQYIVAVSGSNGKTSTVEMIAYSLRSQGFRVVYNEEGSNQIEGVTTLVLGNADLSGRVKADVLLIESDERYAAKSFKYFHPTHFVVTNLYRDQLTRNGHPEWVLDALRGAVYPETELILNADDPLSSTLGIGHEKTIWFGMDRCACSLPAPDGVYHDGTYCPVCHGRMVYSCAHYNHIGHWQCTSCGRTRPEPAHRITAADLGAGTLTLDGAYPVQLALRSIYNAGNILAAYSAVIACGGDAEKCAASLSDYTLKNGRVQRFRLGAHEGTLLTSKHENSIAYDTNLRYIAEQGGDCSVLVIVDAVSRKYFTSETSWLWDIDFDRLNVPGVEHVYLSGRYCSDLAARFECTLLPPEKWEVIPEIPAAAEHLKANGSEKLYVVTCFSDRDKLLNLTEKEAQ